MQTPNIEKKNERREGGRMLVFLLFFIRFYRGHQTRRRHMQVDCLWNIHSHILKEAFSMGIHSVWVWYLFFPLIDKMSGRAEWCLTMFGMESTFMREGTTPKAPVSIYSLLRRVCVPHSKHRLHV